MLQGVRNGTELVAVKKMLQLRAATLLPVTENITQRAIGLMESLTLSHGLQLGDALIAAANIKHFGAVSGLRIEAFVPDEMPAKCVAQAENAELNLRAYLPAD
jgi:hypothetical protein